MRVLLTVGAILILFISCEIVNPEEEVPAFIEISNITVASEPTTLGVSDAWVYIDGNLQGVYELPAEFPVLEKGIHELNVLAGIKVNGISATRSWYPFYTGYSVDANFNELETITISPVVDYIDEIVYVWQENFENIGINLDTAPSSATNIQFQNNDVYSGSYSGLVFLDEKDIYFEVYTTTSFSKDAFTAVPSFLEMNYKNDAELRIGMYIQRNSGNIDTEPVLTLNPSEEWNKIYIDLLNPISNYADANSFILYFLVYKQDTTITSTVLLDNMRVVLAN